MSVRLMREPTTVMVSSCFGVVLRERDRRRRERERGTAVQRRLDRVTEQCVSHWLWPPENDESMSRKSPRDRSPRVQLDRDVHERYVRVNARWLHELPATDAFVATRTCRCCDRAGCRVLRTSCYTHCDRNDCGRVGCSSERDSERLPKCERPAHAGRSSCCVAARSSRLRRRAASVRRLPSSRERASRRRRVRRTAPACASRSARRRRTA